jgi:hypothetical protein
MKSGSPQRHREKHTGKETILLYAKVILGVALK